MNHIIKRKSVFTKEVHVTFLPKNSIIKPKFQLNTFSFYNWILGFIIEFLRDLVTCTSFIPFESFIMESQMTRNRQNGEIQIAGFAPTRLIISIFHHLIGQYFESGILFISASQSAWRKKIIRRVGANPAIWIFPFCQFRVTWNSIM